MNNKIASLNSLYFINTKLFTNCLEGVTQKQFLERPNGDVNNIAFVAGHVLDARYYLASLTGLLLNNPYKEVFDKIKGPDQADQFPPASEIIKLWKEISVEIEDRLKAITEEELQKECPIQFPLTEKTVLGGIEFLIQHEAFHIGQIAVLRKFTGLPAMRYI